MNPVLRSDREISIFRATIQSRLESNRDISMTQFANIGGPLDSVLLRRNSGRESVIIEALVLVASFSIVLCVEDTN